jgi:subfamily B ATP-binding cassette protein HlyB/CyaB
VTTSSVSTPVPTPANAESEIVCSSGVLCLAAIAHAAGASLSPQYLQRHYGLGLGEPQPGLLVRMAEEQQFKASLEITDWKGLLRLQTLLPAMVRLKSGQWVVLVAMVKPKADEGFTEPQEVAILDPLKAQAQVTAISKDEFGASWDGNLVLAKRKYHIEDSKQPFGFRWFLGEILNQKAAFRDVAATSIILTLIGMASPIFTQLVIDKVLAFQVHATLIVLVIGMMIAIFFETAFGYLRSYLLLGATNKIDMRLTRKAFNHLLSLPIQFFETTSAGVIMRHLQQLERIRGFMTGPLFFMALESVSIIVFLPLLFMYSPLLTAVVLGFTLAMALVIIALIKPYQVRLEKLYNAEGRRQSILVEAIHGMRTVKALALEPMKSRDWNERSANSILTGFEVFKIGIGAGAVTGFLERSQTVAVIGLGALLIFDNELTVGSLIAFQMISGRVTGPLVAIVGLVHQYQETALSVRMLGEVMNHPSEGKSGGGGLRPNLAGSIRFEEVGFRYPNAAAYSLSDVSLDIQPGQVIGLVGRSGSGKTTLTRLIQAMYSPNEGVIRIDGIDIREIDLAHLRSSIGVVLQDNFMFRGTVRDNIAASRPNASLREVIAAAQAAGADEFIERLPQGYDTLLEENASNLSGGQKQRLSIARAILPQPKLLILDEAASALDPESEAIFIRNLRRIAVGKTVLMVSHRLSTLVKSDAIFVFDRGKVVDQGKHDELLTRCEPYQTLWRQQMGQV